LERIERKSKMKKLLLITTCLVALSTPTWADCPYTEQLKSLMQQKTAAIDASQAAEDCSPSQFNHMEGAISIMRQADSVFARAKNDNRCVARSEGVSNATDRLTRSLSEWRTACQNFAQGKKDEEALRQRQEQQRNAEQQRKADEQNSKEVPTPRHDNNSKLIPTPQKPTPAPQIAKPSPNYIPDPGTKTFDEGGIPGIAPIPYDQTPAPRATPTTPPTPDTTNPPPIPVQTPLESAEEEVNRANQTVQDNIPNNKLSCDQLRSDIADLYAYAAQRYDMAGMNEKARIAKDRSDRVIAVIRQLRAAGNCNNPAGYNGALANYKQWFQHSTTPTQPQHSTPQPTSPTAQADPNSPREKLKRALEQMEKEKNDLSNVCAYMRRTNQKDFNGISLSRDCPK
jgi:hypothetical protein